ncbi:major facilitator superfamily domain-containing protein [Favolaschia claudopus]|uniref:Major facilitator superfamily domain-containing protein n=1 Tax=Favolaschia claudopus TaxID=2862362 RepID=A0AAW0B7V8_9AGAR
MAQLQVNHHSVYASESSTPRGSQITWDGPEDPANPKNWSVCRKWIITFISVLATLNGTFASSAPSFATAAVREAFRISSESYLLTSVFLIGYVVGPLLWGPGREIVGRRPIFVVTMSGHTMFYLGQALAANYQLLLISRFFGGFFALGPLVNAGGVIADIWDIETRGKATSLFSASVFLGPALGQIAAGLHVSIVCFEFLIEAGVSWRWVFWMMMVFSSISTGIVFFGLSETYEPVLLLQKLKARRNTDPIGTTHMYAPLETNDWSPKATIDRTVLRPFKMLAGEPILVLVTFYLSVYLLETIPIIFMKRRHFNLSQTGLVFTGLGVGTSLGALLNHHMSRHYTALIETWRGFPPPEERLLATMIGGCLFPIAILWLGWSGQYSSVPWYVPALATIFVGIGISTIFIGFLSYLVDTYLIHSATALAANTLCRSLMAAGFPLFTVQIFHKLGIHWALTVLAGVGVLLAPSPFLFYKYGPRIRVGSKFAPCKDLEISATVINACKDDEKQPPLGN